MPLYEYGCDHCGTITELMQKMSDAPLAECPKCGAPVRKLMSRTSFQLKGTGWYTTDYKKKSGPAPTTPAGEAPAAGAAVPKTDATPAASPAPAATPAAPSTPKSSE